MASAESHELKDATHGLTPECIVDLGHAVVVAVHGTSLTGLVHRRVIIHSHQQPGDWGDLGFAQGSHWSSL